MIYEKADAVARFLRFSVDMNPSLYDFNQKAAGKNHLLAVLPREEFERINGIIEPVEVAAGQVLYEADEKVDYAYFPMTAIVSLASVTECGKTVAFAVVGNEGVLGVSLFLGGDFVAWSAVVKSAGRLYRIRRDDLMSEFRRGGRFRTVLLRYAQALYVQISQTAVCNRFHDVDHRLCRWLLLSHDRLNSNKFFMTHEHISDMLGVRREGVTLSARKLAARNLIMNRRGTIEILDRKRLEAAACECYGIVSTEYNRLLGKGISRVFG